MNAGFENCSVTLVPTAKQLVAETQATPSSAAPFAGLTPVLTAHLVPFQRSISGSEPTEPTAMQLFATAQETDRSVSLPNPNDGAGLGLATIFQALPSQCSVSVLM